MKSIITSPVTGSVWKLEIANGAQATKGQTLILVESMKMEIPVEAPAPGRVVDLLVAEGEVVTEGQPLIHFELI